MRFRSVAGSVGMVVSIAGALSAQNMAPPQYLQIFREEVKIGRAGPHAAHEAGWPRAFAKAKTANHYIALTSVAGPSEAWFIEGHATFAEIDSVNKAIEAAPGLTAELDRLSQADAANVSSVRTLLAMYVPEMSNPSANNPAEARVWEITIFRVRPGKDANLAQAAKLFKEKVQQSGVENGWAVYRILSGMPGPTYLVMSLRKTLAELDPLHGPGAAIEKTIDAQAQKQFETFAEGYVNVETFIFAPSPQMSYLPAAWVAQDTKYWSRKSPAVVQAGAPRAPDARKP